MRRRLASTHCDVDAVHWSRFLDGEFSSAKCRQCEEHLAGCPGCRAKLRDMRRTVKALQAAGRRGVPRHVQAAARRRARALTKGER